MFDCNSETDLLNEILIDLNKKNEQQLDEIDSNCINLTKFRSSSGVVQNIISICDVFKVDKSVKYTSIELFDKLLVQLVCDTKRVFLETVRQHSGQQLPFDWPSIELKLKKQMHLRAVTCVIIATKMIGSKNTNLSMTAVQRFLQTSGYTYSLKNLNSSEIRVLKLLNFKLVVNSVDVYVDTLLAVLKHNIIDFDSFLPQFESTATKLIDLYYMCRKVIARNAFKIMSKRLGLTINTNEEELETERISTNKMLTSCAIIGAIPLLTDISIYEQIVTELSEISRIPYHLIVDMSQALLILIYDQ